MEILVRQDYIAIGKGYSMAQRHTLCLGSVVIQFRVRWVVGVRVLQL